MSKPKYQNVFHSVLDTESSNAGGAVGISPCKACPELVEGGERERF